MNFINAVTSGKPFKQSKDNDFFNRYTVVVVGPSGVSRNVGDADLQANDWDVKKREAVINSADVTRAMSHVVSSISLTAQQQNIIRVALEEALNVKES